MPIYKKAGVDKEFELPEDFDIESGIDRNREKALAKGYQAYVDVTKDGQKKFAIPDTEIEKATAKGYRLYGTEASSQKPDQSVLESAARGIAQVGTFGLADEIGGTIRAFKEDIPLEQGIEQYRQGDEQAAEQNPVPYYGTQIATGLVQGGPAGILGQAGVGAAQGAAMAEGDILDRAKGAVTGGAIGAAFGGAAKGIGALAEKVGDSATRMVKSVVGETGEKFVSNPALVDQAEKATVLNKGLLNQNQDIATQAAIKGEEGLAALKGRTDDAYNRLSTNLNIAPVMGVNVMDNVDQILANPAISQADKLLIQKQIQALANQNMSDAQMAQSVSKVINEVAYRPRNLGSEIERQSAYELRQAGKQTTDSFHSQLEQVSPEIADMSRTARELGRENINTRETLRKRLGTATEGNVKELDSAKIASKMSRAGDKQSDRLILRGQSAGIGEELNQIRQNARQIGENRSLATDLTYLKKPASPLSRSLNQGIFGIGSELANKAALIDVHNTVQSVFKSAPLTTAVKMLTRGGKTLSFQTIQELAKQHGVDEDDLRLALTPNQ